MGSLPQKTSQSILLLEASVLTSNFRNQAGESATKAEFVWKENVERILSQTVCVGICAVKDDGSRTVVLFGVDSNGDDLTTGALIEDALPCPPFCSTPIPLSG